MEEYMYPGDAVSPISIGYDYREYLLSDVLREYRLSISGIDMLYARGRLPKEPTAEDIHISSSKGCYVMLVLLSNGRQMAIAPLRRHHNLLNVGFDPDVRMTKLYRYSDAVLRYYVNAGGSVFRPVWAKMVTDGGGYKESIGPEIDSPFTLIWGSLVSNYRSDGGYISVSCSELDIDKEYVL